ncbi:hypothetical protein Pmani_016797 [Petrolisthes manimaculis]|uniref:Uncharacterized protein n=1 Tax=Petrolisthes manimaculis TaxID=1843537 RepID=A0AAE1PPN5_9EUCA|nr:hypothetical protein Pmani_016797 [Petrolisthes manimaculis]
MSVGCMGVVDRMGDGGCAWVRLTVWLDEKEGSWDEDQVKAVKNHINNNEMDKLVGRGNEVAWDGIGKRDAGRDVGCVGRDNDVDSSDDEVTDVAGAGYHNRQYDVDSSNVEKIDDKVV